MRLPVGRATGVIEGAQTRAEPGDVAMRRFAVLLALHVALVAEGCQQVRPFNNPDAGETGYAAFCGKVQQRFTCALPVVERATAEALQDIGARGVARYEKEGGIKLVARFYDDRYGIITLAENDGATYVTTFIGNCGDEPLSKVLFDMISIRLSTMSPAVLPPPVNPSESITHRAQDLAGYRGAPLR